jgi:hypothetical protein
MHKIFGALAALTMLSGCVAEQPAKGAALTELQASCETYGFKAGTDGFSMCILQLDQQRMANARDRRMAVADSLQQTGASMQANARRQSNCTYNQIGNSIQQYCY